MSSRRRECSYLPCSREGWQFFSRWWQLYRAGVAVISRRGLRGVNRKDSPRPVEDNCPRGDFLKIQDSRGPRTSPPRITAQRRRDSWDLSSFGAEENYPRTDPYTRFSRILLTLPREILPRRVPASHLVREEAFEGIQGRVGAQGAHFKPAPCAVKCFRRPCNRGGCTGCFARTLKYNNVRCAKLAIMLSAGE